jgi:hypothetical protein
VILKSVSIDVGTSTGTPPESFTISNKKPSKVLVK